MNVEKINNCYGCGVCAVVCSKNIINIELNIDGFYEPRITNFAACTNCGLCAEVCSYTKNDLAQNSTPIKSYAAWSRNSAVRLKSSSGGVGFEIGRALLAQGYKVCGVQYNPDNNRAEHYIATSVDDWVASIGSKYIQSYTVAGFKSIKRDEKNLVIGTPCQIDSFRRYANKFQVEKNFILVDHFCHGVPSMLLWKKYIARVENNKGKIVSVSWRNKFIGKHDFQSILMNGVKAEEKIKWHDSYNFFIETEREFYNSRLSEGDIFYKLFFSDSCLGKACYNKCKFKYDKSSADIRIGDMWGKMYQSNQEGVSCAIAFTEKGHDVLGNCECEKIEYPFDVVAEGQMLKNASVSALFRLFMLWLLKRPTENLLECRRVAVCNQMYKRCKKWISNPKYIINKIVLYFSKR